MEKILLAAPIYNGKEYIIDDYLDNVKLILEYSKLDDDEYFEMQIDTLFVDNSKDHDFSERLKKKYPMLNIKKIPRLDGDTRIAQGAALTVIRDEFLKGNYTHLFLLESDIIPHPDILLHLLSSDKDAVAAPYFLNKKKGITCVTKKTVIANNGSFPAIMELPKFFDGELKQAENGVGFGCVLIKRKVIEAIEFRWGNNHADTYFWQDAQDYKFEVWIDTSQMIRHYPGRKEC